MKFVDVLKYSGRSIKVQRGRAVLTVLGVVIGIAAIVALNSLVGGFSNLITRQLSQGFSAQTLTVGSGGSVGGRVQGAPATLYYNNITGLQSYLETHGNNVDGIMGSMYKSVTFDSNLSGSPEKYSGFVVAVDFATYNEFYPATFTTTGGEGAIPTDNKSIVIGYNMYHPYGNDSTLIPYNQNVTLSWAVNSTTASYSVNVAGVLGPIGTSYGGPSDSIMYMPISLAMSIFKTTILGTIYVRVKSTDQAVIRNVSQTIVNYFKPQGIVSVYSPTSIVSSVNQVMSTVSNLFIAIAAISLIVAGVNIVNIMTVSVIERTREIGILKAIGAKDSTVLGIFLFEALLIGIIGSLVGIALGFLLSFGLGGYIFNMLSSAGVFAIRGSSLTFIPAVSPSFIIEAFGFGIGTAVLFGIYPAFKASRKPPVDALRYE